MNWADFYGVLTIAVLLIAIKSHHAPTIKYALVLLMVWITSNLTVSYYGFDRAPTMLWITNAIMAATVAIVARGSRHRLGAALFALFITEAAFWSAAFWQGFAGSAICYIVSNIIFAAEVALVGVSGVKEGLDYGRHRVVAGPRFSPVPRDSVVAGARRWKSRD